MSKYRGNHTVSKNALDFIDAQDHRVEAIYQIAHRNIERRLAQLLFDLKIKIENLGNRSARHALHLKDPTP